MSLRSVLKVIGKDLKDAWPWVEEGMNVAGEADPPLEVVFGTIERVVTGIQGAQPGVPLTATQIQIIVTGVSELVTKAHGAAAAPK